MTRPDVARESRNAALDGLRGLAIVLVVLGHAGTVLWPDLVAGARGPYGIPVLRGLLGGGAVVVFFVVGAFIVALGLLRESERGTMDSARFLLRRLVRLGGQLALLALALLLVQVLDPTAPGSMQALVQNLSHMLTFTLNLLPLDHTTPVRADIGHLWYLSVQQQCYLVLPLFVLAFRRRRLIGALVLVALISVVYLHRLDVYEQDGWVLASILTTTRSDGLFWGVLLALALPLLSRFRLWSWPLTIAALGALACQLAIQELPPFAYLGPWSLAYQFFIGLVVVAIWLQASPSVVSRASRHRTSHVAGSQLAHHLLLAPPRLLRGGPPRRRAAVVGRSGRVVRPGRHARHRPRADPGGTDAPAAGQPSAVPAPRRADRGGAG